MLNFFKKKSDIRGILTSQGVEAAATYALIKILPLLASRDLAWAFILQELKAAVAGNDISQSFAASIKISPELYVKYLGGEDFGKGKDPQELLTSLSLELADNPDVMVEFRCAVDLKIIHKYDLENYAEKYAGKQDSANALPLVANCMADKFGFIVQDSETGHTLESSYDGECFTGTVTIPEFGLTLQLNPWMAEPSPFQDDFCFKGFCVSNGQRVEYQVSPKTSFTSLMNQVINLRARERPADRQLTDFVGRESNRGYGEFVDLDFDLGDIDLDAMKEESLLVLMAYAYARRLVVIGMYFQGMRDASDIAYVTTIFKHYQGVTGATEIFQNRAYEQAVCLLQAYIPYAKKDEFRLIANLVSQGITAGSLSQGNISPKVSLGGETFWRVKDCFDALRSAGV